MIGAKDERLEQRTGARKRILLGKQIEECIYDSIQFMEWNLKLKVVKVQG